MRKETALSYLSLINLGIYNLIAFIICFFIFEVDRVLYMTFVLEKELMLIIPVIYTLIALSVGWFLKINKYIYALGILLSIFVTVGLIQFFLTALTPIIEPNPEDPSQQIVLSLTITIFYLISLTFRKKFLYQYKYNDDFLYKLNYKYLNDSLKGISIALLLSGIYLTLTESINFESFNYIFLSLLMIIHYSYLRKGSEEYIINLLSEDQIEIEKDLYKL